MRQRSTVLVLFASMLAAGSGLTGCATTGAERAAKATNSMQTVENEYRQVNAQVDATNASLQDLISPNQTDMKKALEGYKTNVAKMEKLGKQVDKQSAEMNAQGQNYFAEWEKHGNTFADPQMRQLSEERRLQLRDVFAQIPQASVGVKGSLQSYLTEIRDIEKFLSNDLTPKGVETITPVAQRARQEGEALKTSVNPVLAAIGRAKTAMAQGGPTSGAAAGGQQPGEQPPVEQQPVEQPPVEQMGK